MNVKTTQSFRYLACQPAKHWHQHTTSHSLTDWHGNSRTDWLWWIRYTHVSRGCDGISHTRKFTLGMLEYLLEIKWKKNFNWGGKIKEYLLKSLIHWFTASCATTMLQSSTALSYCYCKQVRENEKNASLFCDIEISVSIVLWSINASWAKNQLLSSFYNSCTSIHAYTHTLWLYFLYGFVPSAD